MLQTIMCCQCAEPPHELDQAVIDAACDLAKMGSAIRVYDTRHGEPSPPMALCC